MNRKFIVFSFSQLILCLFIFVTLLSESVSKRVLWKFELNGDLTSTSGWNGNAALQNCWQGNAYTKALGEI